MRGGGGTLRLRAAVRSVAGAVAVTVLILAVTHLALRLPAVRLLGTFPASALISYDRFLGELTPLTDAYINRVLGLTPGRARTPASAGTPVPLDAYEAGTTTVAAGRPQAEPVELKHAFTNDDFANALRPERLPFLARTDTTSATRQPGEPTSCAPLGGTAWYAYRPDRAMTLVADTFGTSYAAALAVFRGSSLSSLEQVGCSRSVTGNSAVSLRAASGQTYWFQISGPAGGGALTFSLTSLGRTSRISVATDGRQSTGYNHDVATLSPDGRYVAFTAASDELGGRSCGELGGQHARCHALYLRDRVTGTTELLLHASPRRPNTQDEESRQAMSRDKTSYYHLAPTFSGDGRYISFHSDDPTLVPGDNNGHDDVFVFDRMTHHVERVSVSSSGREGTTDRIGAERIEYVGGSYRSSMSADGRYVVFTSAAEGLVPDDTNHHQDVFVRDRRNGVTERVSVRTGGGQLNGMSITAMLQTISGDGRYVVFTSYAPNTLAEPHAAPCTSAACDGRVLVHDRSTRTTTLVARTPDGRPANGPSQEPSISADGRVIAFTSTASDLVAGDTNEIEDVFWLDLRTGRTLRASVSSTGEQQRTPPVSPGERATLSHATRPSVSLSQDGRYLAFSSPADNLAPGDANQAFDVFVHDARTRSTARLSLTDTGGDGDGDSFNPFLSADGRSVVFGSLATNLVSGDTNGKYDLFVHDSAVPGRP